MPGSVIVGGARTPIGKLSGALKGFGWTCAASPFARRWLGPVSPVTRSTT